MNGANYIVATIRPWNIATYRRRSHTLPGSWRLVSGRDELTADLIAAVAPRYVFFPHWSWTVPRPILDATECVCFHMTDLPYGRGGSPLQNLIVRGHKTTMISALRMTEELDAGPLYMKRPLDLSGSAQAIYERTADIVFDMMAEIAATEPVPEPQRGAPTVFPRRRPEESELPDDADAATIYDHIRMLDAEGYPRAFRKFGNLRVEFSDATFDGERVAARAVFRRHDGS